MKLNGKKNNFCNCNCELENAKELIFFKGKTMLANAKKCPKCGEIFFSPDEGEKIRMELNPTFLDRLKK